MVKETLRAMMCEESGEMGLTIVGTPALDGQLFVAMSGILIAHDIVEHMDFKQIGGAAEELLAMGAAWYVRGRHGDVVRSPNVNSAEQHIASDVGYQCWYAYMRQDSEWDLPVPMDGSRDIDHALPEIFRHAMKEMIETEEIQHGDVYRYFTGAKRFMRKGYDLARERYHDTQIGNRLFWNIAEAVDSYIKYNELYDYRDATLMYDLENGVATICDVTEDGEYDY